jgi:PAS domain S-box-containing protein
MPDSEFRLLADNAPVMVWRAGIDGSCDWFNRPWLEFTGQTLEHELGEGWTAGIHPEDRERCLQVLNDAVARRSDFKVEYRLRRHDGTYRWVLETGAPFYRDGTYSGYFGSCIDITDHRETEQRLRDALAEREVLLREVHHRVKNNLQALLALVRLTRREADATTQPALDALGRRLTAMALVQRELHDADNMARLSVRSIVGPLLSELPGTGDGLRIQLDLGRENRVLPGEEAVYLGLGLAEAIGLMQRHGCKEVAIKLDGSEGAPWSVTVEAECPAIDEVPSGFETKLIKQYARGAGGRAVLGFKDGHLQVELAFDA